MNRTSSSPSRIWIMAVVAGLAALAPLAAIPADDPPADKAVAKPADAYKAKVAPLLQRYCADCHSGEEPEAGIAFDRYDDQAAAVKDGRVWLRVLDVLEARSMPPVGEDQPTLDEFDALTGWIENDFLAAQCGGDPPPAPVVVRRLNRQEYNATIRDLLGIDADLAADFPQDDIGFGFDNVGSALNVSPVHVEKYLDAAEAALERAIALPDPGELPPIELIGLQTYPLPKDRAVEFPHKLRPGRYVVDFSLVRVGVAEDVPPPRLIVGLGRDRRTVEAARVQDETVVYRYWLDVAEGDQTVHVALAPGQAEAADPSKTKAVTAEVSGDQRYGGQRGLHVDSMVVQGPVPLDPATLPASHRALIPESPGIGDAARIAAGRKTIARFAERAFRRPVRDDEVDRLVGIFRLAHDRGESFERSVQVALTAALVSPQFLYLIEPEDAPEDRPLTEFELASRLSYFLWSSLPDEALFREARAGTLRANLRRQVDRMLDDPKAARFVENFTGQWLQLRKLAGSNPDPGLFPGFDAALRESMRRETEATFAHVLAEDRSILELLDADYAFLNGTLARHYGIDGVTGEALRKVALPDRRRGGLLTQASVLTLTSNPNRTSPVKRGQWILQQILGTPPPPPPPEVPKLDESADAAAASSLRDRLEAHRSNPQCASCHQQMDPLGFALENYDAIGRWRQSDGGGPVDPSGTLAGGRAFADARELKAILATTGARKFAKALVENLMTYALGRGLEPLDYCTVEDIRASLVADDYHVRTAIRGIVASRAFQNRGASR